MIANPSQEQAIPQGRAAKATSQAVKDPWQEYEAYLNCIASERRETARAFVEYLAAKQLSKRAIMSYFLALRSLEALGKPYTELTKQDLMRWSTKKLAEYKPSTANLYRKCIKRFYKWLLIDDEDSKEYPEIVKWMKTAKPKTDYGGIVLNKEQVLAIIQKAENHRDRALLFTLYESGARAGELLSLRIKDVTLDQYGAVIRVRGKTGERRIRLIESTPDLRLWLECHPQASNSESALWIGLRHSNKPITYVALYQLVEKYAKRAGLDGEITPHIFRHTRATHLADKLKEPQMREYFGWTRGSDMPATYVHLSGRDIDNAILELNGIKTGEKQENEQILKPKACPRCKYVNSPAAKFCQQCSLALDVKTAIELDQATRGAEETTNRVLEYLMEKMPSFVAEAITATNSQEALRNPASIVNNLGKGMGSLS